ncbi:MAG TPA: class I SAM-dependent methyltransferase [Thermomicrobiales bacterium]|jgi:predicted O-methyltransferase YrrM
MSELVADPKVAAVLERLYREDEEQRRAGLPSSARTRNVTVETGRFLYLTARATGARFVLEIGSSNGVSTIWLALAMRSTGGRVTGTEILPGRVEEANAHLAEAGLADFGTVVLGDARETARAMGEPLDLVFIDAEKDDYVEHFAAAFPRLRSGGLVLADNVASHDLSVYQAMLRARDDVESVTLPLERGIEYSCKR